MGYGLTAAHPNDGAEIGRTIANARRPESRARVDAIRRPPRAALAACATLLAVIASSVRAPAADAPQSAASRPATAPATPATAPAGGTALPVTDYVYAAAFSPDSRTLALVTAKQVLLWDVASRQVDGRLPIEAFSHTICFSPDGKLLAVGSFGHDVRVFDVQKREVRHAIKLPKRDQEGVSVRGFANNGTQLVTSSDHVRTWSMATGQLVRTLNRRAGYVNNGAMSADGNQIVIMENDGALETWIWDLRTSRRTGRVEPPADQGPGAYSPGMCVFSPNGRFLIQCDQLGRGFYSFAVPAAKYVGNLRFARPVIRFTMSGDGTRLAAGTCERTGPNSVVVLDAANGARVAEFGPIDTGILAPLISPDGRHVAAIGLTPERRVPPTVWELPGAAPAPGAAPPKPAPPKPAPPIAR